MITDSEVSTMIDPLCNIYQQIEFDIIKEIGEKLATYDKIEGSLDWKLKKLLEYQDINAALVKIFSQYSGRSDAEIKKLLEKAQYINVPMDTLQQAFNEGIIAVDPIKAMKSPALQKIAELSYKDVTKTFKMIKTKAIQSANQAYMHILNTAYVETASGAYSLQDSIQRGLKRFAESGVKAASYKRTMPDGTKKIINYSLESVVRRDAITAVHQLANKSSIKHCEEIGTDYVEVSSHLGARVNATNPIANHAGWQGGIYKINGRDKHYPNLKEKTGYPDDILGLGGVNCRHRIFAFIPGVSVPNPIKYGDTEENKKVYLAQQKQRYLERQIRRLKKEIAAIEPLGDSEALNSLKARLKSKQKEIQAHCNANGLRREYSRELVSEQITKNPLTKAANNGTIKTAKVSIR